jgi:glutamate N-acetyltransferase/amino-acid N-acetyltransferase
MKHNFKPIPGSVVAPQGFLASGVFCDIKRIGTGKGSNKGRKRDLALIVSEVPAAVAGMFTTNQICAAPVKVCVPRVKKGRAQAIVVNSGNANACTGKQGMKDALEMTALTAKQLHMAVKHVLVASTGRIGMKMPMGNVKAGIFEAAQLLGNASEHGAEVVEAIMTSDTRLKQTALELKLGRKCVRMGGICKGAGMIQPGMSSTGARPAALPLHATMLCFITTDAAIEARALQAALEEAVAHSFNRITVDGDMSTNDTVLVLANGLAENPPIKAGGARVLSSPDFNVFRAALSHVCLELAKMIVRDGEGASRFVTIHVSGAKTFADADAAARAVANSALVKTSWHGGDPNWGRIIDALGYSRATVVEEKVDIGYSASPGGAHRSRAPLDSSSASTSRADSFDTRAAYAPRKVLWSLKRGQPTTASFKSLCAAVAHKEFDLHINLNLGKASAVIYAADLTEDYVDFNKGDVSDPSSLGG